METRNILNYLGVKIGELQLPDGTPEEIWTEKLSVYALPPAALETRVYTVIEEARVFARKLISEIGTRNIINGKTESQIDAIIDKSQDILLCLQSGSLKSALRRVELLTPDSDMTQDDIDFVKAKLKGYLGY